MRDRLFEVLFKVLSDMKREAAIRSDENMIAVIHKAETLFSKLPTYLHPGATTVTSNLLDGTQVHLAEAPSVTRDSAVPIQAQRQIETEVQRRDDLAVLEDPSDDERAELERLQAKHPEGDGELHDGEDEEEDFNPETYHDPRTTYEDLSAKTPRRNA